MKGLISSQTFQIISIAVSRYITQTSGTLVCTILCLVPSRHEHLADLGCRMTVELFSRQLFFLFLSLQGKMTESSVCLSGLHSQFIFPGGNGIHYLPTGEKRASRPANRELGLNASISFLGWIVS